ncbi:hypothetical protein BH09PSE6_BH09PSE6_07190 [soil metagenome]
MIDPDKFYAKAEPVHLPPATRPEDVLYSTTREPVAAEQQQPDVHDQDEDSEISDEAIASRNKTFDSVTSADTIASIEEALDPELEPQVAHAAAVIYEDMARSAGLDSTDVKQLIATSKRLAETEVTVDTVATMQSTARAALEREFPGRADEALAAAQEHARRDPRVLEWLERSRMGDDAATIVRFAMLGMKRGAR